MDVGKVIRVAAGHSYAGQVGTVKKFLNESGRLYWLVEFAEDGAEWRCPKVEYLVPDLPQLAQDEDSQLTAPALCEYLMSIGIRLYVESGGLRYDAPKGAMTPDLAGRLKAQKDSLVQFLSPGQMVCFSCDGVIPPGQPAGEGPLMTQMNGQWRFYHLWAKCLPPGRTYNPETTHVERISL